jgi:hypothetical protein
MAGAKVPISKGVSARILARIASFASDSPQKLRWLVPYVKTFGALPLYHGWTETIGIRPDGEVIERSTEDEYEGHRPVEERTWILISLVTGARHYPELRSLLPVREPGAIDCPCRSVRLLASGEVICGDCCGLGWLPAANPLC